MPRVAVVTPCYDDFACVSVLAQELNRISIRHPGLDFDLLVVNDSPWIDPSIALKAGKAQITSSRPAFKVLNLSANLGHQRAIAIGLAKTSSCLEEIDYIVTIDSDGEDDPHQIPAMIRNLEEARNGNLACVAARRNRAETFWFRVGYLIYKQMTRLLAGTSIDYGNYICFLPQAVQVLVRLPDTSIHLAAALMKSRIPFGRVEADRRKRYLGHSKMGGYSSLVLHAFRAYSVLGEKIAVRLIILTLIALLAIVIAVILSSAVRLTGIIAVFPGWGSLIALNLISLGIISACTLFSLALTLITSHASFSTTPLSLLRHYAESEVKLN